VRSHRRFPNSGARGDLKDIDAIRSVCHRCCSGSVGLKDKTLLEGKYILSEKDYSVFLRQT